MSKKTTPEQEAIRAALRQPERRAFFSRRFSWGFGMWPCRWGFFFDWKSLTINFGEGESHHGSSVPTHKFGITFTVWPFCILCFWKEKRIFWIGDREWKKGLFKG